MSAAQTMDDLTSGIRRIHEQGGGALRLDVFRPQDAVDALLSSMSGNAEITGLLRAVAGMVANVAQAPKRQPVLCGSCPRPVRAGDGYSVVVARPACDEPRQGITLVICAHCATDIPGIQAKAGVALRRIWPDLRPITPTHAEGGHA